MLKQPSVRASAVHDALAFLEKFQSGARERVLARVPAAARRIVESTARTGWIHVEHDRFNIDAVLAVFGATRALEYWAGTILELVERPLLRSFVSGMLAIINLEPARLLSVFATGWPLVYRDMCDVHVLTSESGNAMLRFEAIAPQVRVARNYLMSWHGACVGFARLTNLPGRVQFRVAPDVSWAEAELVPNSAAMPSFRPSQWA